MVHTFSIWLSGKGWPGEVSAVSSDDGWLKKTWLWLGCGEGEKISIVHLSRQCGVHSLVPSPPPHPSSLAQLQVGRGMETRLWRLRDGCTFLYPGQDGHDGNDHTQDECGAYVHLVQRAAGELDQQEVQHNKAIDSLYLLYSLTSVKKT